MCQQYNSFLGTDFAGCSKDLYKTQFRGAVIGKNEVVWIEKPGFSQAHSSLPFFDPK